LNGTGVSVSVTAGVLTSVVSSNSPLLISDGGYYTTSSIQTDASFTVFPSTPNAPGGYTQAVATTVINSGATVSLFYTAATAGTDTFLSIDGGTGTAIATWAGAAFGGVGLSAQNSNGVQGGNGGYGSRLITVGHNLLEPSGAAVLAPVYTPQSGGGTTVLGLAGMGGSAGIGGAGTTHASGSTGSAGLQSSWYWPGSTQPDASIIAAGGTADTDAGGGGGAGGIGGANELFGFSATCTPGAGGIGGGQYTAQSPTDGGNASGCYTDSSTGNGGCGGGGGGGSSGDGGVGLPPRPGTGGNGCAGDTGRLIICAYTSY
jgi:hypothetical protein